MNLNELETLLNEHKVNYELLYHEKPIHSINDAKAYFDVQKLAPVIIIKTDKGYFAVILSATRGKVDFNKLKEILDCRQVKLASKQEVYEVTGYEIGKIPLIGHGLPCIFDSHLLQQPMVYGGTGAWNYTLKIEPNKLIELNNVVVSIT